MRSWGERGLKPVHLCLANIGLTILFSMAYRLSLKWSEGGPGESTVSFSARYRSARPRIATLTSLTDPSYLYVKIGW